MPHPNIETPIHFHASLPKFGGRNANSVVLHRFPGSWSSSRSSAPWWRWPPTSGVSAEKLNYFASFKKVQKIQHRQKIKKICFTQFFGPKDTEKTILPTILLGICNFWKLSMPHDSFIFPFVHIYLVIRLFSSSSEFCLIEVGKACVRWRRRRYVDKMRETDGFVDDGRRRRPPKELRPGRLLCPKKESFFRPEKREGKAGGAWIIFLHQKTLSSPHAGFLAKGRLGASQRYLEVGLSRRGWTKKVDPGVRGLAVQINPDLPSPEKRNMNV